MLSYYIPVLYTLKTRYNTKINSISFVIITLSPSLFFVILFNGINPKILIDYIIAFIAMQAIYECGYLFNDLVTIRYEQNPTKRMQEFKEDYLLRHLQNMLSLRLVLASLAACYLVKHYEHGILFIYFLLILLVDYTLHNFYRNRFNIITMCAMVSFKYFVPCILFIPLNSWNLVFFILFVSVPLVRTFEYASKTRYNLHFLKINNFEIFRIKYYSIGMFIGLLMIFLFDINWEFFLILAILFIFRTASFLLMNNQNISSIICANRKRNGN